MGGEGRALDALAMALMIVGELDASVAHAREALPRLAEAGDRQTEASCLANLAWASSTAAGAPRANPAFSAALEAARAIGARAQEAYAHAAGGELVEPYGEWGRALVEGETGAGDRARAGPSGVDGRGALGPRARPPELRRRRRGARAATRRCWGSRASFAPRCGSPTR